MMPEVGVFTPLERQYMRLYVNAAKKDWGLLSTTVELVDEKGFGMNCVIRAAVMAQRLQEMQADCETMLADIASRHKLRPRHLERIPNLMQLTQWLAVSFFKLVTVVQMPDAPDYSKDAGWFSGKLDDWKDKLPELQQLVLSKKQNNPLSNIFTAVTKLFKKIKFDPTTFDNLPSWPVNQLPPNFYDQADDDYYYYDDGDDNDDYKSW